MKSRDKIKIVGVILVRDEDLYIHQVVSNILEFCDEAIILDNYFINNMGELSL